MLSRILILILAATLCSCTPMPGNKLLPGLTQPTPIEQVQVTEHIGPLSTSYNCMRLMIANGQVFWPVFIMANSLGYIPACADVRWDTETGVIKTCDVYLSFDMDSMRKHEMRHCEGYADWSPRDDDPDYDPFKQPDH